MSKLVENKLIEITNSLSQLDSARKKVEDVTSSSRDILIESQRLSQLYKDLYDQIASQPSGLGDTILNSNSNSNNNNKSLESSLKKSINNWEDQMNKQISNIQKHTSEISESLKSINEKHKDGI